MIDDSVEFLPFNGRIYHQEVEDHSDNPSGKCICN